MAVLPDTEELTFSRLETGLDRRGLQKSRQAGIPDEVCRMEPLDVVEAQSSLCLAVGEFTIASRDTA